jgi:hypothetical protein
MESVQDGRIKIRANHFPTFLYDESPEGYDPREIDKGLCRGYLLLRVSGRRLITADTKSVSIVA